MLVRAARFELMDRLIAGFFDDNFDCRTDSAVVAGLKGLSFSQPVEAVGADDFTEGNERFSHRRTRRGALLFFDDFQDDFAIADRGRGVEQRADRFGRASLLADDPSESLPWRP